MSMYSGTERPNLSRETKFSGVDGDREIFIFPVQLTTSRIGSHYRLVHTLLEVMTTNNNRPHRVQNSFKNYNRDLR